MIFVDAVGMKFSLVWLKDFFQNIKFFYRYFSICQPRFYYLHGVKAVGINIVFLFVKEKLYSLITMNMDEQLAFSFLFIF